ASTATINVLANATLFVAATTPHTASLMLNGGDTGESIGQLRLDSGAVWSGPITLAGAITGAGDTTVGSFTGTGTISGNIGETGGAQALSKSGAGNIVLSGTNSYTGLTTVAAGAIIAGSNSALGTTDAGTVVTNATSLRLANGITIPAIPLNLRGTGANNGTAGNFSGGLTTADNASATWSGSVTLGDSNARIGSGNNGTLHLSGPILGSGANQSLSLSSGSSTTLGTVVLSGANNFTGNISIVRGNLRLGAANTLPATAILDVGSANIVENTTFDLAGFSQSLAGLRRTSTNATQASTVTNSSATAATLTRDVRYVASGSGANVNALSIDAAGFMLSATFAINYRSSGKAYTQSITVTRATP
ncbi:MAG: hypothetical protein CFE26_20900, partial [Verrucomicrobiales bacterium VVV1]